MDIRLLSKILKVNNTLTISHVKEIEQILINYNVNEGNIIVKNNFDKKPKKPKKQVVMTKR